MYNSFLQYFNIINNINVVELKEEMTSFNSDDLWLMKHFSGFSFGDGLYRLHNIMEINRWNDIVTSGFPQYKNKIQCFGYDWLGRQFAIDLNREKAGRKLVLMFEPGTGEVLEIPCNFLEFHNEEIPNYHDACLASSFYEEWKSFSTKNILKHNECIGYKVPLFLSGKDTIENLELSDMEVYWHLFTQLLT